MDGGLMLQTWVCFKDVYEVSKVRHPISILSYLYPSDSKEPRALLCCSVEGMISNNVLYQKFGYRVLVGIRLAIDILSINRRTSLTDFGLSHSY